MSLTYSYIRETCVQGVIRGSLTNPISLDRVRAQFDAAFFSINSTVAQAYAAREDRRELLRVATTLTIMMIAKTATADTAIIIFFLRVNAMSCTFD